MLNQPRQAEILADISSAGHAMHHTARQENRSSAIGRGQTTQCSTCTKNPYYYQHWMVVQKAPKYRRLHCVLIGGIQLQMWTYARLHLCKYKTNSTEVHALDDKDDRSCVVSAG
jgi:hypothetical protein